MGTAVTEAIRRSSIVSEWIAFFTQVIIAVSVEVGDDLGRGFISQHGTPQGIANARDIVAFEIAHGFFIEPAWQTSFEQTRHVLIFTITWIDIAHVMNGIYVLGHVFVTLGVAFWLYFYRRHYFPFVRNVVILTNIFALIVYENFPVAPPRLTPHLWFDHHPFNFQDTVFGVAKAGGQFVPQHLSYNEFSAFPSVHIAWALVAGGALLLWARPWPVKALGACYPFLMLVSVVVTGNHYLLDAAGAVGVVAAAIVVAACIERIKPWVLARVRRSSDASLQVQSEAAGP